MNQKAHRINVSFSAEDFEALSFLSKKRGQSLASLVRYLTRDGLEEREEERLEKMIVERKKGPFIPAEEFWKQVNSQ